VPPPAPRPFSPWCFSVPPYFSILISLLGLRPTPKRAHLDRGRGGLARKEAAPAAARAPFFLGLLVLVAFAGALAAGCGGGPGSGKTLRVADIGWTENTAVSALTKVLLEEELGYERVTVLTTDLDSAFDGVARGDLDAFQDLWLPNQRELLDGVRDDAELVGPWYRGRTQQGIGVPSYMPTTSLSELNGSGAELILGIEPSSVVMGVISGEVIPSYGLSQQLVAGSTDGMLAEVEDRYRDREEFAFVAWSPHWMNQRYDFRYLEDPKNAFGELNETAEVSTLAREDLGEDDPVARAFLGALALEEDELNDLEDTINEAGDPTEGARSWARDNREVVRPWIEAAEGAKEA
jgi:glycine betaine/proline transport system substrate-binding protein